MAKGRSYQKHWQYWCVLPLLAILTLLHWQLRYTETGKVYATEEEFVEGGDWYTQKGRPGPEWGVHKGTGDTATFRAYAGASATQLMRVWPAKGGELMKVRLFAKAHAMDGPDHQRRPTIYYHGETDEGEKKVDPRHMVTQIWKEFDWRAVETVMRVPDGSDKLVVSIAFPTYPGEMEIAAFEMVGVKSKWWWLPLGVLIAAGWAVWIAVGLRRRGGHVVPALGGLWLMFWGMVLVFPRAIDAPRPVFDTFWSSSKATTEMVASIYPENAQTNAEAAELMANLESGGDMILPEPEYVKKAADTDSTKRLLNRIKSNAERSPIGRFLFHAAIMGVVGGTLLLFYPFRRVVFFVAIMALGIELVPQVWYPGFEWNDVADFFGYIGGMALAIPLSREVKKLKFWPRQS